MAQSIPTTLGGNMKVLLRIAAPLIVAVLLATSLAAQPVSRSVLLIDQSSAGLPFNTALASAIRLALNTASAVPISFYSENLDANRFLGSDYEEDVLSFFRKKYRDRPIDAVVVVGICGARLPYATTYGVVAERTRSLCCYRRSNRRPGDPSTQYDWGHYATHAPRHGEGGNNSRAESQKNCCCGRSSGATNLLSPFPRWTSDSRDAVWNNQPHEFADGRTQEASWKFAGCHGLLIQRTEIGSPGDFSKCDSIAAVVDEMLQLQVNAYHALTKHDREHLTALLERSFAEVSEYIETIKGRPLVRIDNPARLAITNGKPRPLRQDWQARRQTRQGMTGNWPV
jgi:hypothetical protein